MIAHAIVYFWSLGFGMYGVFNGTAGDYPKACFWLLLAIWSAPGKYEPE